MEPSSENQRDASNMPYVDGFVIVVPNANIEAYRKMAELAAQVWREYGALDYKECLLDDEADCGNVRSYRKMTGASEEESVVFAYIVYPSRGVRDEVNAKVMADPRMGCPGADAMPFDPSKMAYAGFRTLVSSST